MADGSSIEWTDASWTPIRARLWEIQNDGSGKERVGWHCERVSEGCRNCYAEKINRRLGTGFAFKPGNLRGKPGYYGGGIDRPELFLDEKMLLAPLRWRKPRRIFVCSMTDLFASFVPDEWIDRVFAVMALCPQHTFQVLTKRPERMRAYLSAARAHPVGLEALGITMAAIAANPESRVGEGCILQGDIAHLKVWPLPNVWLGTSAEDQPAADQRIPELLATPAAVRFVSAEPLLGPIDFERVGTMASIRAAMPTIVEREERGRPSSGDGSISGVQIDAIGSPGSSITFFQTPDHMGGFTAGSPRGWPRLDWIIVGGESGPNARPMHPDWARSIRDQCEGAGVAFFFKQWGSFVPNSVPAGYWPAGMVVADHHVDGGWCFGNVDGQSPAIMKNVGKAAVGRLLDGRTWDEFPGVRP